MGGTRKAVDTGRDEVLGTAMQSNTITMIAFHKKKINMSSLGLVQTHMPISAFHAV
jgi:hypothetical protein